VAKGSLPQRSLGLLLGPLMEKTLLHKALIAKEVLKEGFILEARRVCMSLFYAKKELAEAMA